MHVGGQRSSMQALPSPTATHHEQACRVINYDKRRDIVTYYSDGNPWITQCQETS